MFDLPQLDHKQEEAQRIRYVFNTPNWMAEAEDVDGVRAVIKSVIDERSEEILNQQFREVMERQVREIITRAVVEVTGDGAAEEQVRKRVHRVVARTMDGVEMKGGVDGEPED